MIMTGERVWVADDSVAVALLDSARVASVGFVSRRKESGRLYFFGGAVGRLSGGEPVGPSRVGAPSVVRLLSPGVY